VTTYVYETIPQKKGERPKRFEVRQSMKDDALTEHPETGVPVKRVPMGGFGLMGVSTEPSAQNSCSGPSCGCC